MKWIWRVPLAFLLGVLAHELVHVEITLMNGEGFVPIYPGWMDECDGTGPEGLLPPMACTPDSWEPGIPHSLHYGVQIVSTALYLAVLYEIRMPQIPARKHSDANVK